MCRAFLSCFSLTARGMSEQGFLYSLYTSKLCACYFTCQVLFAEPVSWIPLDTAGRASLDWPHSIWYCHLPVNHKRKSQITLICISRNFTSKPLARKKYCCYWLTQILCTSVTMQHIWISWLHCLITNQRLPCLPGTACVCLHHKMERGVQTAHLSLPRWLAQTSPPVKEHTLMCTFIISDLITAQWIIKCHISTLFRLKKTLNTCYMRNYLPRDAIKTMKATHTFRKISLRFACILYLISISLATFQTVLHDVSVHFYSTIWHWIYQRIKVL